MINIVLKPYLRAKLEEKRKKEEEKRIKEEEKRLKEEKDVSSYRKVLAYCVFMLHFFLHICCNE